MMGKLIKLVAMELLKRMADSKMQKLYTTRDKDGKII